MSWILLNEKKPDGEVEVKVEAGWFIEYQDDKGKWLIHDVAHLEKAVQKLIEFRESAAFLDRHGYYRAFRLRNGQTSEIIPEEAIQ